MLIPSALIILSTLISQLAAELQNVEIIEQKWPGENLVSLAQYEALNEQFCEKKLELAKVDERLKSVQEQLAFQKNMFDNQIQSIKAHAEEEKILLKENSELRIQLIAEKFNTSFGEKLVQCKEDSKSSADKIRSLSSLTTPSAKVDLLNLTTGFYYISSSSDKDNWFTAAKFCKSVGLELTSVETREESEELARVLNGVENVKDFFWLSGTDLGSEGHFYWSGTGKPFGLFKDFSAGNPDNGGGNENCVHFWHAHPGGKRPWNDYVCDVKLRFICELENNKF